MAWIENFEVHGLAGRAEPVRRELDRRLNVFWGLNGAGKTTLFKILHAALKNDTSSLNELPFDRARVTLRLGDNDTKIIRSYTKRNSNDNETDDDEELFLSSDISIGDDWVTKTNAEDSGWHYDVEGSVEGLPPKFASRSLTHSYLPITRIADGGRRRRLFHGESPFNSDEAFVEQVRDRWQKYSNSSLFRIREVQQQGLATVLAILFGGAPNDDDNTIGIDNVDPDEAYQLVRRFLAEQEIALHMDENNFIAQFEESPVHRQVVTEIQAVRSQTEQILAPQREFQAVIDSMYRGDKHLVLPTSRAARPYRIEPMRVEVGEKSIALKSLSSGEKQLLQILLEVLSTTNSSVMIDEPELSMHVNWQQQLVSSMQRINDNCQLLLASHSPEIMAEVPDDYIFEL